MVIVGTWNVGLRGRACAQTLETLASSAWDIALVQEIDEACFRQVAASAGYAHAAYGRDLAAAPLTGLGVAIFVRDGLTPLAEPALIPQHPAPESAVTWRVDSPLGELEICSAYVVPKNSATGRAYPGGGAALKKRCFQAINLWMRDVEGEAVVGTDANSPERDRPRLADNRYWRNDSDERRLHDPRGFHRFDDAYRRFYAEGDDDLRARLDKLRTERSLAHSHQNHTMPGGVRYDFLFVTPGIGIRDITHETTWPGGTPKSGAHRPLVAHFTKEAHDQLHPRSTP